MINVFSKLRRSRHRGLLMVSLTVVLCLGLGALLARPAYRMVREWRIERNAENAALALAAGDYAEARRLAMSVLKLHRERHDMLVILQRSMEELKDPNAVNISRALMAGLEPETLEVVVQALDLACILGKIQPATLKERVERMGSLSQEISQSPRFRELMATALLLEDKPEEAVSALGPDAVAADKANGRAMAVTAVAKAMLGDDKASSELFKRIDWNLMLREEREFFTGLLERLSAPGSTEPIGNRFDPKILPPSDDPIETPSIPEILPPIDENFGKKAESATLPPITDAINEEFKPKPLPTLPPAKTETKPE